MADHNKIIVQGTVSVPKSVLRNEDLEKVYTGLRYPTRDGKFIFGFQEDVDRFYLPKFWFLKNMGATYRHLIVNKEPENVLKPRKFNGELRPHQQRPSEGFTSTPEMVRLLKMNRGIFAEAPCGCHAPGTPILMADGTIKPVENIEVGDMVMGSDGPRTVLELHSGTDAMYRVVPKRGDPFVVNAGHILTIKWTGTNSKKDHTLEDICVLDWLKTPWNKGHSVLVRCPVKSFITQPAKLKIPPYILGVLLGDGALKYNPSVSSTSSEIRTELEKFAKDFGVGLREETSSWRTPAYYFPKLSDCAANPVRGALVELGLFPKGSGDKFIPHQYKTASVEERLDLLAGIFDTDGHLHMNCYDYVSKSPQLAKDVAFVCRSLGFDVRESVKINKKYGSFHRLSVSGHVDTIPCRIGYKRAAPRSQIKRPGTTGFHVEKLGPGAYHGFTVDGDHRYLMGDFTLTHNSGKTVSGIYTSATLGGKTIVVVPSEAVFKQWVEQVRRFDPEAQIGFYGGGRKKLHGDVVIAMLQTLYKHTGRKIDCDLLIVDEAHMIAAEQFQKCVFNVNFKYSLPLTATGKRFDNLDPLFRNALGLAKVSLDTDQMPIDIHLHPYEHQFDKVRAYNIEGRNKFGLDLKLAKDEDRNIFLVHLLKTMVEKGRRLLVLGKYKEHLTLLAEALHKLTGAPYVMYMGSTSPAVHASIMQRMEDPRTVMFATLKKGGVGMDIQHFDCLVTALPVADPRQLIGRIQRFLPDKRKPVVIDPVDNIDRLKGRAYVRVKKGYLTVDSATVINHCPFLNFHYSGRIKKGGI